MNHELWQLNSQHTLRLLHKYKSRDLAQFLDIFDSPVTNHIGDEIQFDKAPDVFFERVIGILPIHVKEMNQYQIIRVLEVMNNRNIGSQRLFENYILHMIEKQIFKYDLQTFIRMIKAMAERQYVEDFIFWDKFGFKYVFYDPTSEDEVRKLSHDEAKMLWDTFVFVKFKCPTLDIKEVLTQLEKFLDKELIEE